MSLFRDFRWQDVVDLLIIAFVVYQLVLLIRGTRAVQMILGVSVLAAVYQGAQYFELYTVNWILDSVGNVLLIIVVVTMDFMTQVQAYLMSQQYESLLRKANFKGGGGLPTL